jgi:hypothetical protein
MASSEAMERRQRQAVDWQCPAGDASDRRSSAVVGLRKGGSDAAFLQRELGGANLLERYAIVISDEYFGALQCFCLQVYVISGSSRQVNITAGGRKLSKSMLRLKFSN